MRDNNIDITIFFKDNKVERELSNLSLRNQYWKDFKDLSNKESFITDLSLAFSSVHNIEEYKTIKNTLLEYVFKSNAHIFQSYEVPFYLRNFFKIIRIEKKSNIYSEYIITIKACKEYYFYLLEGIKEKDNKKILLSMPYFKKSPPPLNPQLHPEKVRGVADTILFLSPLIIKKPEQVHNIIKWFEIKLRCKIIDENLSDNTLTLRIDPEVKEDIKYLSLPPDNVKVLVSSPNYRKAISDLYYIWSDKSTKKIKSVLISADSGSGKEVLVDLLSNAMFIEKEKRIDIPCNEKKKFKIIEKTLLDLGKNELKNRILNAINYEEKLKDSKSLVNKIIYLKNFNISIEIKNKLLELSDKKNYNKIINTFFRVPYEIGRYIIFLDEIHQNLDIRFGLYRLLDHNILSKDSINLLSCKNIIFILATSNSVEGFKKLKPADLFNRIRHIIKLKHPLKIEEESERKEVIRDYFKLFWDYNLVEYKNKLNENSSFYKVECNIIDNLSIIVATKFVEKINALYSNISNISIRSIGNIVTNIFQKTTDYLEENSSEQKEEEIINELSPQFEIWINRAYNEYI